MLGRPVQKSTTLMVNLDMPLTATAWLMLRVLTRRWQISASVEVLPAKWQLVVRRPRAAATGRLQIVRMQVWMRRKSEEERRTCCHHLPDCHCLA